MKQKCEQCRYYLESIKFCGHFKLEMTKHPSDPACKLFDPREDGADSYEKQQKGKQPELRARQPKKT